MMVVLGTKTLLGCGFLSHRRSDGVGGRSDGEGSTGKGRSAGGMGRRIAIILAVKRNFLKTKFDTIRRLERRF